ncbi:hypothetical protein HUA74_14010 [Myxococcus sp. CA051A]|uniref:hypothetical protein n=1 Tax=unclassified Myxococcus TaxID=2648731 RepID=UPI00157A4781|nr:MULTISPECIES: hypothetical protein [unclassified Myxococcus]NTX13313.1 hypothetical protein [Myxococcus sp. CA056]NTX36235.1 hypothetical protein [Myxococcus sp. CA033]NTX56383.1 hypothetical protein [Myxococcus sp. CA039A]NTX61773.1 hypothetical protein [Myxococcus sp. CA051A]
MPPLALAAPVLSRQADPVRVATERLARTLPSRTDATVLVDMLEDDLREGLDALGDVEAHFSDLLSTLRTAPLTPVNLVNAGDDPRIIERLDYLQHLVLQLRKRLSQAAAMARQTPPSRVR